MTESHIFEQILPGKSDAEIDFLVASTRHSILTDLYYLRGQFSATIPTVNDDISRLSASLGISPLPELSKSYVNYFFDHDRFEVKKERSGTDIVAFERNGIISICLHCTQKELSSLNDSLDRLELFGLPPQFGFLFTAQLYTRYLMHHENLHRIHYLSRTEVPYQSTVNMTATLEMILEAEAEQDLNQEDKENLDHLHGDLKEAREGETLKIHQEGALLFFSSGERIIAIFGEEINESIVRQVAKMLILETSTDNLYGLGKALLSEIDPEGSNESDIQRFIQQSGKKRLKSFLTSNFFDKMQVKLTEKNITQFITLILGRQEFFVL